VAGTHVLAQIFDPKRGVSRKRLQGFRTPLPMG
jgi:hypothetical protein